MSPTDTIIMSSINQFAEDKAITPGEKDTLAEIARNSVIGIFSINGSLVPVVNFKPILNYFSIPSDSKTPPTVALTERGGYLPLKEYQYSPFNFAYQG